jgi:hypothetical protein
MSEQTHCSLSVYVENGEFVLRDDRGLPVTGVRLVSVKQQVNEPTIIAVELVSRPRGEKSMLKGGHIPPEAVRQLVAEIGEEVRDGAKLDLK